MQFESEDFSVSAQNTEMKLTNLHFNGSYPDHVRRPFKCRMEFNRRDRRQSTARSTIPRKEIQAASRENLPWRRHDAFPPLRCELRTSYNPQALTQLPSKASPQRHGPPPPLRQSESCGYAAERSVRDDKKAKNSLCSCTVTCDAALLLQRIDRRVFSPIDYEHRFAWHAHQ